MKVLCLWHTAGSKFIIWPEGHSKADPRQPQFRMAAVLTKTEPPHVWAGLWEELQTGFGSAGGPHQKLSVKGT